MKRSIRIIGVCLIVALLFSAALTSCAKTAVAPQKDTKKADLKADDDVQTDDEEEAEPETVPYVVEVAHEWPERSVEELVTGADLIIRAKNVGFEPSYRDNGILYTDFIFEVVESYKGDRAVGDEVAVKCYGGFIGDVKTSTPSDTPIKEGQEYIIILTHETDGDDVPTPDDKYVYYPPKGILTEGEDGVFTAWDPAVSYTVPEFRAAVEAILC